MGARRQVDALKEARGANHTRVGGHSLEWSGAPHNHRGQRLNATLWDVSGPGHAKCFCGEISESLPSANKRRAWHRQHKLDVLAERSR